MFTYCAFLLLRKSDCLALHNIAIQPRPVASRLSEVQMGECGEGHIIPITVNTRDVPSMAHDA